MASHRAPILRVFQGLRSFIRKKMKIESIKTIGIVAYGKDYDANVSILNMSFY